MRVFAIGDSHLNKRERFKEKLSHLDTIISTADTQGVDLFLHPGDIFDRTTTPWERFEFAKRVKAMTALAPLILIQGNHDPEGDLEIFTHLNTKHPVHVVTEPHVIEITDERSHKYYVGCMPWMNKAELVAALPNHVSSVESNIEMSKLIEMVIEGWQEEYPIDEYNSILAGHMMMKGAVMSSGDLYPNHGVQVCPEFLDRTKFGVVIFNHVHKPQRFLTKIWYVGSQCPRDFGEANDEKRFLSIDMRSGVGTALPVVNSHPLENRHMKTVRLKMVTTFHGQEWVDTDLESIFDHSDADDLDALVKELAGLEVRVILSYPADNATQANIMAEVLQKSIAPTAYSVKLDMRAIPIQRTRCADIATAKTPHDKLKQWCEATKYNYNDIEGRLTAVLADLEGANAD